VWVTDSVSQRESEHAREGGRQGGKGDWIDGGRKGGKEKGEFVCVWQRVRARERERARACGATTLAHVQMHM